MYTITCNNDGSWDFREKVKWEENFSILLSHRILFHDSSSYTSSSSILSQSWSSSSQWSTPPYYHHHHNHPHIAVTYNCNYVPSNVLRVKGPLLAGGLPTSWAGHRNFWGNFESFREGLPFPFVLFLLVIFLYVWHTEIQWFYISKFINHFYIYLCKEVIIP